MNTPLQAMEPALIDVPMPIRTPRLLLRHPQPGDGALTSAAVYETWDQLHRWMEWARRREDHTAEKQELRTRNIMAQFILREELHLLGIETATGLPVVWCGLHHLNWSSRQCEAGYWVRRTAQNRGFATEATHALLLYAFTVLGMHRVGISYAGGNEPSRRVIQKLGFVPEGIQQNAALLPGDRLADRHLYARLDLQGLPPLDIAYGVAPLTTPELSAHLRSLEQRLLDPAVRSSPPAVAALLTDDFREFGSSGRVYTRQAILDTLSTESPVELHLTDLHCEQLAPSVALVTYRSHRRDAAGNLSTALRSSLWLEQNGLWRLRFHQGTRE